MSLYNKREKLKNEWLEHTKEEHPENCGCYICHHQEEFKSAFTEIFNKIKEQDKKAMKELQEKIEELDSYGVDCACTVCNNVGKLNKEVNKIFGNKLCDNEEKDVK